MAPSLSRYTPAREGVIDTILSFLQTPEANMNGTTINFFDRPMEPNDIFAGITSLAIYWQPQNTVTFQTDARRMVVRNTTSAAVLIVEGFTVADWSRIEAFEVDCRRAILENAGLGCVATSSLWQTLEFRIEIQHRDVAQDRRCSFRATLEVNITEDMLG